MPKTDIVNVALIGAGRVAGHHANMLLSVEGAQLGAVCDLIPERGEPLAAKHGVPYFTSYHDMLRRASEIDVVVVATPSGMHYEHGVEIIERYRKHVIMEKPPFMTPAQLDAAYGRADAVGVRIFPVFQNRYNVAVQRVKRAMDAGELGSLRLATVRVRWHRPQRYYDRDAWRGTYSHDGGCLTNQGVHYIDILRYLAGEVAEVNATMTTLGVSVEVENIVAATCRFGNGALGVVEITTAASDDFEASVSLVGDRGMAVLSGIATNELATFSPDPSETARYREPFETVYGVGHRRMYEHMVRTLCDGVPEAIDRADARATVELLHALYRSDEIGGWIAVKGAVSERLGRPGEAVSALYRTPAPQV